MRMRVVKVLLAAHSCKYIIIGVVASVISLTFVMGFSARGSRWCRGSGFSGNMVQCSGKTVNWLGKLEGVELD